MSRRFRTALVGVGRIGMTYADDPVMRRHFRYASHAQVLAEHPAFAFEAVVDPNPAALAQACRYWGIAQGAASVSELRTRCEPEVLVLATPPTIRASAVEACPGLKAVLCEKPLDATLDGAQSFVALCEERRILLQVNLWRRCDPLTRRLAEGEMHALIGRPQAIHGVYGNGLLNNGTHLVDMCRMLFGEIVAVRALGPALRIGTMPLDGDFDVACLVRFADGSAALLQPLDFDNYREVGLDIWGDKGRLEILNESLVVHASPRQAHRALSDADEIATDAPQLLAPTAGEALYHVYDNLGAALGGSQDLASSGRSAARTMAVIETVRRLALAASYAEEAVCYERADA